MAKRWKQRPEGSTWGDWGDDDSLGRINLIDTAKRLEGVREVQEGISFCLSLPLDYPGGSDLNQRRYPPILSPTEDLAYNPDTFFNVHMSQMGPGVEHFVDMWCDDKVTLWLQYSTQWDTLCHVGAEFDADGDGVEEAVYYNGFPRARTWSDRRTTPRAPATPARASPSTSDSSTWRTTECRAGAS